MIIGAVAAVVIIGGYCCYKKNSDNENEGGSKEDKKLFKKVFKGKTQKKAAKEEIIPTFAVPSEEQVWKWEYKFLYQNIDYINLTIYTCLFYF